jgi:hypothetical protein
MARRKLERAPFESELTDSSGFILPFWQRFLDTIFRYVYRWDVYSVTFNPASVAANTTSEQTVTVTGVSTGDIVHVIKPSHDTGLGIVNCRVSAIDTVAITFMNTTGSAIDPSSEDYIFKVEKV